MTENQQTSAPPPGPGTGARLADRYGWATLSPVLSGRALHRGGPGDRKLAGVCAGLARWLDVDPLLVRVALGVLTLFGGSGVLLYGLAWLLVPEDGQERSEAAEALHGRSGAGLVGAIVLVVLGVSVFGVFGIGVNSQPSFAGLLTLLVLAVAVVAAVRGGGRRAVPPPPTLPSWPAPADPFGRAAGTAYSTPPPAAPAGTSPTDETVVLPAGAGAAVPPGTPEGTAMDETMPLSGPLSGTLSGLQSRPAGPPPAAVPPYPPLPPAGGYPPYGPYAPFSPPPPLPPAPRRERSRLGRATVSLALLAAGAVAAWGVARHDLDAWPLALAAALGVTGLGLVVGAFAGRARGLIALGLVLTLLLSAATVARAVFGGGAGDRTWAPTSAATTDPRYDLGAGSAVLDLTRVHPTGELDVVAHVGLGQLVVTVPRDVAVEVLGRARAGEVRMPDGGVTSGTDVEGGWSSAQEPGGGPAASAGRLVLDLRVGLGNLEVRRAAS
ncbi:MAG TPA: PspC domain-containing protein [Motilibacteraceae bacterium]|nr:PspC domain-containing protein [Motilibacteraceae bacterium]